MSRAHPAKLATSDFTNVALVAPMGAGRWCYRSGSMQTRITGRIFEQQLTEVLVLNSDELNSRVGHIRDLEKLEESMDARLGKELAS